MIHYTWLHYDLDMCLALASMHGMWTLKHEKNKAHKVTRTKKSFLRSFNLSKGAATLADLLEQMNDAVPALDHPDPHTVTVDLSSPAGADPNLLARCGQWAVTASGRFEFTAAITSAGKIKEPKNYAPNDDEFFVNIKMSESMRRVLGTEDAEIRVFGRESSLKTYRRLIDQIHTLSHPH